MNLFSRSHATRVVPTGGLSVGTHRVHQSPMWYPLASRSVPLRAKVKVDGMAWGNGEYYASDDDSLSDGHGEDDGMRMERTKEYVKNILFGGGWRGKRVPHQGGVMSSSVNRGLSDVVTRLDTRDAMEACQGLEGDDKEECYVVFGVDRDADMWYDIVSKFDALLGLDTDPLEESVHRGQERV